MVTTECGARDRAWVRWRGLEVLGGGRRHRKAAGETEGEAGPLAAEGPAASSASVAVPAEPKSPQPLERSKEDTMADEALTKEDEATLRALYRKLDWHIIPALWVCYFLASSMRSNVGLSLTMNTSRGHSLEQTLHLTSHETSTGVALFYVAYVVLEVPSNLVITIMPASVWLSRIQFSIGLVSACHAILKHSDKSGFYALRFMLGVVEAGLWPGMAYYLSNFYDGSRMAKRIGWYYTAAQLSAAVVGLVSAGFQKMDGVRGLLGFEWMFLIYGVLIIADSIAMIWWLPASPEYGFSQSRRIMRLLGASAGHSVLNPHEQRVHRRHMAKSQYEAWGLRDLFDVVQDVRLWPIIIMYFGVVGVGVGIQNYGSLIISSIDDFSSITISLLFAPIWLADGLGILVITPFSDRYRSRCGVFIASVLIILLGMLITTLLPEDRPWGRYAGLLVAGFGLGPTVPICMTWSAEVFDEDYANVGVAAAAALVSGLGNLGSVTTTYALYAGWASDTTYYKSNSVMCGILGISIIAAVVEYFVLQRGWYRRPKRVRAD